ncbi:MAG: hypothetical protein F6J95_008705 [Leptolyngbya sp. SIO1E4]|nr:hypothetical protein [Leptolyngbya sp. SIO1E4]
MQRFFFSGFAVFLVATAALPAAAARQTSLTDSTADLNGDGFVSLTELKNYNRDARQS